MNIEKKIAEETGIRVTQVEAVIKLIDEGNTIPFIARYRKEVHGGLDDEQIRTIDERMRYLRNLSERKDQVIHTITEQGQMTDELALAIENASTLVEVEDLYRPYRPKRRTRATVAKERGLEPLAVVLYAQETSEEPEDLAKAYVDPEKEVPDVKAALAGAKDILAEKISDSAVYRTVIREYVLRVGRLLCTAKDPDTSTVYDTYYDFERQIPKVANHAVLAINRGEAEKVLTVTVDPDRDMILQYLAKKVLKPENPHTAPLIREVIADSFDRLIWPSIEREVRNILTEKAEDDAIKVFGKNLTQLLMQPPIANKVVLGWDPAFRTGCKLAVVDGNGKVLDTAVIYPTAPQNKVEEAKKKLRELISKYRVELISVGNGTASRESEQIIAEFIREYARPLQYVIVNEAGASVYSASKLATEEFPQFDVGQRSAASIARRLQDPLAELVKIDPKSIGVGQYQHDMNQKKLGEALHDVVEDAVNKVGVNVNTASVSLLEYVAGVSKTIAKNIVAYREANGSFTKRAELLKVDKLGPKAYEQCAGFLRIPDAPDLLDRTAVHPESYSVARQVLDKLELTSDNIGKEGIKKNAHRYPNLAGELGVGEMTLEDILSELEKPSRDPRDEMPRPVLRQDIMELEQLKPGMVLKGTVRNVIDFGAFVDIGVHQDGLVHISAMSDKYIRHPLEVVSVGDVVEVTVLSVDVKKKRIQLSMKGMLPADGQDQPAKKGREKLQKGSAPKKERRKNGSD